MPKKRETGEKRREIITYRSQKNKYINTHIYRNLLLSPSSYLEEHKRETNLDGQCLNILLSFIT